MANPPTQEPGVSSPATAVPIETGMSNVAWGTAILGTQAPETLAQTSGYLQLVSVALNDTETDATGIVSAFTPVTNGAIQCRPNFESHLYITSHWFFTATAGGSAPTTSLNISLQLWLNGYFVLISPSGWGNSWTIQIPPIAASTTTQFSQTFQAWVFNLEFRAAPNAHHLQFMYKVTAMEANWASLAIKPRMLQAQAFPSFIMTFVNP